MITKSAADGDGQCCSWRNEAKAHAALFCLSYWKSARLEAMQLICCFKAAVDLAVDPAAGARFTPSFQRHDVASFETVICISHDAAVFTSNPLLIAHLAIPAKYKGSAHEAVCASQAVFGRALNFAEQTAKLRAKCRLQDT